MLTEVTIMELCRADKPTCTPDDLIRAYTMIYPEYSNKKWSSFFILFSPQLWFQIFLEVHKEMSEKDYWFFLGRMIKAEVYSSLLFDETWYLLENPKRDISKRWNLMTIKERRFLGVLTRAKLYRGCLEGYELGLSWTLNKKIAKKFADRQNGKVRILEATYDNGCAYAYLNDRKEEEVLIHPMYLDNIKIVDRYEVNSNVNQRTYQYFQHLYSVDYTKSSRAYKKLRRDIESTNLYENMEYYKNEYKPKVLLQLNQES